MIDCGFMQRSRTRVLYEVSPMIQLRRQFGSGVSQIRVWKAFFANSGPVFSYDESTGKNTRTFAKFEYRQNLALKWKIRVPPRFSQFESFSPGLKLQAKTADKSRFYVLGFTRFAAWMEFLAKLFYNFTSKLY